MKHPRRKLQRLRAQATLLGRVLGTMATLAIAPLWAQQPNCPEEACAALIEALDRDFNAGEADGYLRRFESTQTLLLDHHSRRIRGQIDAVQSVGERA